MKYGSENVEFEVIKKNGKPFVRMTAYGRVTDMRIWKANTDKPYVKYCGMVVYLEDEMKEQIA